jgi:hypothetical protein
VNIQISYNKTYIVEKCKFNNCRAGLNGEIGSGGFGGGIYAEGYNGKIKVAGCEFSNCYGHDGGGICVRGCESEFDDCIFTDCSAYSWGGGICIEFWGKHNFSRCIFLRCRAEAVFIFFF